MKASRAVGCLPQQGTSPELPQGGQARATAGPGQSVATTPSEGLNPFPNGGGHGQVASPFLELSG